MIFIDYEMLIFFGTNKFSEIVRGTVIILKYRLINITNRHAAKAIRHQGLHELMLVVITVLIFVDKNTRISRFDKNASLRHHFKDQ